MSGKCPGNVPEKIEKNKGGLKMGPKMDGVGWGEPTEVLGGPWGSPGVPWGPRGPKKGGKGVRGAGGGFRGLIHGSPISPFGLIGPC